MEPVKKKKILIYKLECYLLCICNKVGQCINFVSLLRNTLLNAGYIMQQIRMTIVKYRFSN